MKLRLIVVSFISVLLASGAETVFGKYGEFSFAGLDFRLNYCAPGWVFHTPSKKNFVPESGFPQVNKNSCVVKGRFFVGGELELYELLRIRKDGALTLSASLKNPDGVPSASLHFSVDLPMEVLRGKQILVDGKAVNHGETLTGGKSNLWFHRIKELRVPLKDGILTVQGDFTFQIQNGKAWSGKNWNLRFGLRGGRVIRNASLNAVFKQEPYFAVPVSLEHAANMGFADDTAEDRTGGWTDQGAENDLRMFPTGMQRFCGVPFQIVDPERNGGKGCVALRGPSRPYFPETVTVELPEPVAGKYLYLLNAVAWPKPGKAGEVTVEYARAELVETESNTFSVFNDRETANFWGAKQVRNAELGWRGRNLSAPLGLYLTCFELSGKPVRRITLRSAGSMVWLIAGISFSERPPFLTGKQEKIVIRADKDWMPIHPGTGIRRGSVLDFSGLLEAPAGKYGFLKVSNGHFEFSRRPGVPVRFYGINIVGDVHFMADNEIDRIADEFAASGYNQVRFHHFDNLLKRKDGKSTGLDPSRLERMDYWIAALKKRGIYVTLDLYTLRQIGKGEIPEFPGLPFAGSEWKALVLVNENARRNFEEFSANLLNHVNPYTKLAWKDETAVANISLLNENSIYAVINNAPNARKIYERKFEDWLKRNRTRVDDTNRNFLWEMFLLETYCSGYGKLEKFIRSLGVKVPLTDQNFWTRIPLTVMRGRYGFVDNHFYWSHPSYRNGYRPPMVIANSNAVENSGGGLPGMFASRIYGKPFSVSEWNDCVPNSYNVQGVFLLGAYAGYQNWDSLNRFAYSHSAAGIRKPGGVRVFDLAGDPVRMLSDRVGICFFLRGDVRPAGVQYPVPVNEDPYRNGMLSTYPVSIQRLGLVGGTGSQLVGRGRTAAPAGTNAYLSLTPEMPVPLPAPVFYARSTALFQNMLDKKILSGNDFQPEAGFYRSDTGELLMESRANRFSVSTAHSEGFLLAENGTAERTFTRIVNRRAYAGFLIASADRKTLAESRRILLLHLTDCKNTGMRFRDRDMSFLEDWGGLPLLLHRGEAEVTLFRDLSGFRLYAVDFDGNRIAEIPMRHSAGKTSFTLKTDCGGRGVIAYELTGNDGKK